MCEPLTDRKIREVRDPLCIGVTEKNTTLWVVPAAAKKEVCETLLFMVYKQGVAG
uniref:hypothetical protein n=1 Tax=Candidatus Electrothrix sp. TaxID=2170559 RepID=UPI004057182D